MKTKRFIKWLLLILMLSVMELYFLKVLFNSISEYVMYMERFGYVESELKALFVLCWICMPILILITGMAMIGVSVKAWEGDL